MKKKVAVILDPDVIRGDDVISIRRRDEDAVPQDTPPKPVITRRPPLRSEPLPHATVRGLF